MKDRSAKKSINASGLSVSPNSIEVKPVDPVVPPTPIVQPYGSTPDSWTPMVGETLENRVETCLATQPAGTWWNGFVLNHLAACATALTNAVVWDINGQVVAEAPVHHHDAVPGDAAG